MGDVANDEMMRQRQVMSRLLSTKKLFPQDTENYLCSTLSKSSVYQHFEPRNNTLPSLKAPGSW